MPRYDLFRFDERLPEWVDTAETMHDAQVKADLFSDTSECLVLDSLTGESITLKAGGGDSGDPRDRHARPPSSFRHP